MQATLKVPTISCAHCKSTIEGVVKQLSGVNAVEVDVETRTVEVDFDSERLPLEAITEAMDEVGYEVLS